MKKLFKPARTRGAKEHSTSRGSNPRRPRTFSKSILQLRHLRPSRMCVVFQGLAKWFCERHNTSHNRSKQISDGLRCLISQSIQGEAEKSYYFPAWLAGVFLVILSSIPTMAQSSASITLVMVIPDSITVDVRRFSVSGRGLEMENFIMVSTNFFVRRFTPVFVQATLIGLEGERSLLPFDGFLPKQEFVVASRIFAFQPLADSPANLIAAYSSPKDANPSSNYLGIIFQETPKKESPTVIRITYAVF